MSIEGDYNRYRNKMNNTNTFKIILLSFERIRKRLQNLYGLGIGSCSCGDTVCCGTSFVSDDLGSICSPFDETEEEWSMECPSCHRNIAIDYRFSAVECNPTIINDGINSLLAAKFGVGISGILCYKFSMHFNGVKSESVYLVLCGKKSGWNFLLDSVVVCRFPYTSSSGASKMESVSPFGILVDATNKELICEKAVFDCVRRELLDSFKANS